MRANAATAIAARLVAAITARNADAVATLPADGFQTVHHPTGIVYDREGFLASFRSLLSAQGGTFQLKPLATLGGALALCRVSISGSGFAGRKFDVGAYETEEIALIELDARGQYHRTEVFAADRLGDAVTRLYERYAALLPDGPERARAAATARSVAAVAAMVGPFDLDRWSGVFAPDIEFVDPRAVGLGSVHGAEELLRGIRALVELTQDFATRLDDVLALRSDALLIRWTNFGPDRAGGAFERLLCQVWVFGVDGRLVRWEQFDADHDAEALARFDELTVEAGAARFTASPPRAAEKRQRRVRPNAATANAGRFEAAIAARDVDAIAAQVADSGEVMHHPTGAIYDRQASLATFLSPLARDMTYRHEPLATLGDSLALCREWLAASRAGDEKFDVGAYEIEYISLVEVDAQGRRRRTEDFAADRLGDAVVRLYERYADLLPDGPTRDRAAATARSVAAVPLVGAWDLDRLERAAPWFAPAIEYVDHRTVGLGSVHGAEAHLRGIRALLDLVEDSATRLDDVLALRSDAFLVRWTHFGTDRASGGAFERHVCLLFVFGSDGLVTRTEQFDADREAEALARFDELTAELAAVSPARRLVRANAATAHAARLEAAIAARDSDAFPTLLAEHDETIDHTTGATYGRSGSLAIWRRALKAQGLTRRYEPLATLGNSLALCRLANSASGIVGREFDVGPYEADYVLLIEVDAHGRRERIEVFAADRLGDAVARLYERYAELLADGPARARAAATARSVAALPLLGPPDVDLYAAALSPDLEFADHRIAAIGSARGAEAYMDWVRSLFEVADDITTRADDILGLRPGALLVRWINAGTQRVGGGAFERHLLMFWIFGADGLVTCIEQFDVGHEAEALTRFDELTAETLPARPVRRRVRPNAATANAARINTAIAGGQGDALPTLFADDLESVEHTTGAVYDREGALFSLRALLSARDPAYREEPLAALGDVLALCRASWSASGFTSGKFDVGAYEREGIDLIEVDAQGQRRRVERFAVDRLGDAIARLYERYADLLPEGPERARAAATARSSVAAILGPFDPERYATAWAPAIEVVDHRILGTWSARGAEPFLQHFRAMCDLADDLTMREDEVLSLQPNALLVRRTHCGTDRAGGGAYERPFIHLCVFGPDGLTARNEFFDADRDAEALARFDELVTAPRAVRFENAATRCGDRFRDAWEARDWERVAAGFAPGFRVVDRRKMIRLELDRGGHLETLRLMFEMGSSRLTVQLLATRGDKLVLKRRRFEASDRDVGPSEIEVLDVVEVDDHGDRILSVLFDPDDLDAAYAELDERYAAGEAAPYARSWEVYRQVGRATAARDWEQLASVFAPDLVVEDHRPLGFGTFRARDQYVASVRALLDLRSDARFRMDHVLALDDRRSLTVVGWVGDEPEGTFEISAVVVSEHGSDGIRRRQHFYNLDQLDEAWARFAELPQGLPRRGSRSSEPRAPR
ncbi:MAG: nuclear transport factor 2 family protein [Candidatus Binatia bacterium]